MFRMEFKTENAAFEDYAEQEVSRILKEIAKRIENRSTGGKVKDINRNTIGEWELNIEVKFPSLMWPNHNRVRRLTARITQIRDV